MDTSFPGSYEDYFFNCTSSEEDCNYMLFDNDTHDNELGVLFVNNPEEFKYPWRVSVHLAVI